MGANPNTIESQSLGEVQPHRLFEYGDCWLVKRRDTPNYHIYWCREGTRRVRRHSTNTSDFEQAKRRLILFASKRSPAPLFPAANNAHLPVVAVHETDPREIASWTPPKDARGHNVLALLAAYLEWLSPRRSTFVNARASVRAIAEFCGRNDIVYVHEFVLDAQERFVAWRQASLRAAGHSASNGTINRDFSVIKAALGLAYRRGQLPAVPYLMTLPSPPARDRILTAEECRRLLAACDASYVRRFVLLMLHTLQRPKAIFSLRVEQVDLVNCRIDFLPAGSIQSKKRRPMVPISSTVATELRQAIDESLSGYIIEKDGLPLLSMRKAFATAARKAGLSNVTPYVLRHTGATILAMEGVPMHQIASMLGHTTQRTTDIYVKRRPEFLVEAVDKLESVFASHISDSVQVDSNAGTNLRAKVPETARQTRARRHRNREGEITCRPQSGLVC